VVRLFTSTMGLSIVFRRAKGSGFMRGSRHWYIGVIGIHGIGCLSLNRGLPCPTRLTSVHLPGTLNNDCLQSSCVITVSSACFWPYACAYKFCLLISFLHYPLQCFPSHLSASPYSSLVLCLPQLKSFLLSPSDHSIQMFKRPILPVY
jgi:hypothetical protein